MRRSRSFACTLVFSAALCACGRTLLVSDRSTSPDAGTGMDASPAEAQADSGSPQSSFDAATLPAVPVTCDLSLPDAGAPPPPASGARCDPKPRLLVSPASFPVPSYNGPVFEGAGSLAATPAGLYFTIGISENNGEANDLILAGALMRVPLAGGQPTPVACGYAFGKPVVSGTTLIVGGLGGVAPSPGPDAVLRVSLAGGPARVLFALPNDDALTGEPATDGRFVYFPDQDGVMATPSPFGILAVPLDPEAGTVPVRITTTTPVDAVGAFDQRLVFVQPQGAVESVLLPPKPGSQVTSLGTAVAGNESMIRCGNDACWVSGAYLERMDPVAGSPTPIATVQGGLGDLAFDGTSFYATAFGWDAQPFGTPFGPGLVRIPAAGGSAVVLVKGDVSAVAVDDECVYWTSSAGIFSVAKTARGPFGEEGADE